MATPPSRSGSIQRGSQPAGAASAPGFPATRVAALLDAAVERGVRVQGIAGLQGSGKSTLAAQVAALARARGLRTAVLSIDDVYLGRRERRRLARSVHPLLATRGPPGTHDIALACEVLDALRAGGAVQLPRFDKLADRRLPPSRWPTVRGVDLVLFEGWCLAVPPEPAAALVEPINALEREDDPDGVWRGYCNTALGREYPALWSRLDRLLWLQPPDFAPVLRWRQAQERRARAARPRQADTRRAGMGPAEIARFVQHFERVSRQAMRTLPEIAEQTWVLDGRRRVVAVHESSGCHEAMRCGHADGDADGPGWALGPGPIP